MAALKATAIFSIEALKAWLKIPEAEVKDDEILVDIGNFVTDEIEQWTDRIFVTRSVPQVFNGDGVSARRELWRYPVTAVTAFTIDDVAVPSSDYALDGTFGVIWLKNRLFTKGIQNVAITYTAGYALTSVPSDASMIAKEMAKITFDQWSNGIISMNQISLGPATAIVRPDWPVHIKQALDTLRREVRVL